MAQADTKAANTAVDKGAVHDRVAMLSLKADGTPDQTNPEIIGDKDAAVEAAKVQFAEQAVSAVDEVERREAGLAGVTDGSNDPDPTIDALKKKHDAAQSAAEKRAESVVKSLHNG